MTFNFTAKRVPRETAHKWMYGEFTIEVKAKTFREAELKANAFVKDYPKWTCGTSGGWEVNLEFNGVVL